MLQKSDQPQTRQIREVLLEICCRSLDWFTTKCRHSTPLPNTLAVLAGGSSGRAIFFSSCLLVRGR